MKKTQFFQKLDSNQVRCGLCNHFCIISENRKGLCGTKLNTEGELIDLYYGQIIAANIDPIEKKPLFHFLPGTKTFSIASPGCNFFCLNCQNYDISQGIKNNSTAGQFLNKTISPSAIIREAMAANCLSISYTYTEPTIFYDFALDCMKLAKKQGVKNIWVSNGYTSKEALEAVRLFLDAVNIDLKFFTQKKYLEVCKAKLEPILDNLIWYKKNQIWLEITTLIIPGYNDSEEELRQIAEFIFKKLGSDTPWHLSAFFPTYKLTKVSPTPLQTIEKAWAIGKKIGLNYAYGGNVNNLKLESTFCPNCGRLAIERIGYLIKRFDNNGKCQKCCNDLNIK